MLIDDFRIGDYNPEYLEMVSLFLRLDWVWKRKKEMNSIRLLCICCGSLLLTGCATSQKSATQTADKGEQVKEVYLTGVTRQRAIVISEQVLRDMNFSIAKEDANTGYILTRPLAGGQFFEFWRQDNVGAFNTAESSMHSIRRTAELKISDADRKLCINCNVRVQRLSLSAPPERTAGFKYDKIIGQKIRSTSLGLEPQSGQMTWIELGNDELLASAILKKIESLSLKKQM
jgi:hypothetical protein